LLLKSHVAAEKRKKGALQYYYMYNIIYNKLIILMYNIVFF
jgi:hypothetical protein